MTEEKEFSLEDASKQRKEDKDEFDLAFDDAMKDLPNDTEGLIVDPKPEKKVETKDDELDKKNDPPVDDPLLTQKGDGDDPPSQDPNETKTAKELELEAELLAAKNKMATWEGRISAANKRAQEAADKAEALEAKAQKDKDEPDKDLPPSDDDKAIEEFLGEFPDLHKPIVALVKRDLLPIIGQMIDDKIGKIEPEVTSIKETMEADTNAAHFAAITKVCPNWRTVLDSGELDTWIEKQPSYIRDALMTVKDQGSTEEVIDMFTNFNTDTGYKKPVEDITDTANSDAASKAKDLLAVPSSPSEVTTKSQKKDKDDFDAGWDDATKKK